MPVCLSRKPDRLKSSAAISLAAAQAIQDPNLIWPWVALAVASMICAVICPTVFKDLDTWQADFASKERQLGHQQPVYVKEQGLEQGA